jgi:Mn-dependent DtxR family transcriptional regulator
VTETTTPFERRLLGELADSEDVTPASLALDLDADLERVLDAVARLRERGLLARAGFSTCRLTERGREAVTATDRSD